MLPDIGYLSQSCPDGCWANCLDNCWDNCLVAGVRRGSNVSTRTYSDGARDGIRTHDLRITRDFKSVFLGSAYSQPVA
jgi:hypothetical protein